MNISAPLVSLTLLTPILAFADSSNHLEFEQGQLICAQTVEAVRSIQTDKFICRESSEVQPAIDWIGLSDELLLGNRAEWREISANSVDGKELALFVHLKINGQIASGRSHSSTSWDSYFSDSEILILVQQYVRDGQIDDRWVSRPEMLVVPANTRVWRGTLTTGSEELELIRIAYSHNIGCPGSVSGHESFVLVSANASNFNYLSGFNVFGIGDLLFSENVDRNELWTEILRADQIRQQARGHVEGEFLCSTAVQ